jgi:glycosyltransferase A (GT-A) superfamily protein (DUF2064 family)
VAADRLLVFAERPTAWQVQRRLTPALTALAAATLYEACLRDVIARSARERGRVEIWHGGGRVDERYFAAAFPHVLLRARCDGAPATRLADAFARSFGEEAERVVIVAGDAPTLPDGRLTAAFEDLREADVVVGPREAGGCYLIGLRHAAWPRAAALFRDEAWSTAAPLDSTIAGAAAASLELRLLPGWYDIDGPEAIERARADALADSHLAEWLRANGEVR